MVQQKHTFDDKIRCLITSINHEQCDMMAFWENNTGKLVTTSHLLIFEALFIPSAVSRNSRQLSGPGKYFFELIYLSAKGHYWCMLSDMLHEIIN